MTTRDGLAAMGLHYTFYDSRFRFGLTPLTRHYFISSVYDIQKVICADADTSSAWRCIKIVGAFRDGYVSAGCGNTGDTTGNGSFQLDDTGHFLGGARKVLKALRGKIQLVCFAEVTIGDWIYDFADAVAAEIPDYFVDFEEPGRVRAISMDMKKPPQKPAKKIEEAKLETGLLKQNLDMLSGKPMSAKRMVSRKTHIVVRGENLIQIAAKYYNDTSRWTEIYAANKGQIGNNPNLLRVGMLLELP